MTRTEEIKARINALECEKIAASKRYPGSVYAWNPAWTAKEQLELDQAIAELDRIESAAWAARDEAEWTPEVTESRRLEYNAYMRSIAKPTLRDSVRFFTGKSWTSPDLQRHIARHKANKGVSK